MKPFAFIELNLLIILFAYFPICRFTTIIVYNDAFHKIRPVEGSTFSTLHGEWRTQVKQKITNHQAFFDLVRQNRVKYPRRI
jgi:hypothetical protein